MPVPAERPEVKQPSVQKTPEIPDEDPEIVPDEYPPAENSPETPPSQPGEI